MYKVRGEASKARDICLVDFQTLELYSLQEHYISHYIRDYYVQADSVMIAQEEKAGYNRKKDCLRIDAAENGKRICPGCGRKMKQQFIGLKHCKCGMSWKRDIGYFKRTKDIVFALERRKCGKKWKQVPVIRYK